LKCNPATWRMAKRRRGWRGGQFDQHFRSRARRISVLTVARRAHFEAENEKAIRRPGPGREERLVRGDGPRRCARRPGLISTTANGPSAKSKGGSARRAGQRGVRWPMPERDQFSRHRKLDSDLLPTSPRLRSTENSIFSAAAFRERRTRPHSRPMRRGGAAGADDGAVLSDGR